MIAASIYPIRTSANGGTCKANEKVSNLSAAHQQATQSRIIRQAFSELLCYLGLGMAGACMAVRGKLSSKKDQSNTHFLGVVRVSLSGAV